MNRTRASLRGVRRLFHRDGNPSNDRFTNLRSVLRRESCSIDGCAREALPHGGLCSRHYYRLRKYGNPLSGRTFAGEPLDWIESHAGFDGDDCLPWPFRSHRRGYGAVMVDGRLTQAHRVMCEKAHGLPPSPKHVAAHSCGRGHEWCINPRRLRWATYSENEADKAAHGTRLFGERHPMVKLDASTVLHIREQVLAGRSQTDVAEQFGVHLSTVSLLVKGKNWRSVSRSRMELGRVAEITSEAAE